MLKDQTIRLISSDGLEMVEAPVLRTSTEHRRSTGPLEAANPAPQRPPGQCFVLTDIARTCSQCSSFIGS